MQATGYEVIAHILLLFTLQRCEFFSKSQRQLVLRQFRRCCCLPCKGANFSANHNWVLGLVRFSELLFTLQRCEFFSKSQLIESTTTSSGVVVYLAKVRIFQQITTEWGISMTTTVVVYLAKVRIFQQITTLPLLLL